jgi:hypothetical protein
LRLVAEIMLEGSLLSHRRTEREEITEGFQFLRPQPFRAASICAGPSDGGQSNASSVPNVTVLVLVGRFL